MDIKQSIKRYNAFLKLRKAGKKLSEIAELYGVTTQFVSIRLKRGVPQKPVHEKNPFWDGKPAWIRAGRDRIREQTRARDKYKCQKCRKKWEEGNRRFDVHHLNGLCGKKSRGYDRTEDMSGLTTLCHKCHLNLHIVRKKMGKKKLGRKKGLIRGFLKQGIGYDKIAKKLGASYTAVYRKVNG